MKNYLIERFNKMKIIIIIIMLFPTLIIGQTKWKYLCSDSDNSKWYYSNERVISLNSFDVDVKYISISGDKEWDNYDYEVYKLKIYCNSKDYYLSERFVYFTDGSRYSFGSDGEPERIIITSGSTMEELYNKLCSTVDANKDVMYEGKRDVKKDKKK